MIKSVLLDLGGVVFVGDEALPGAVDAIARLRANGVDLRFVTNTTQKPLRALLGKLQKLGIDAAEDEVFMPGIAARRYLADHGLRAMLLVHPGLREDFERPAEGKADAVVIGDAGTSFSYASLNAAFRQLDAGAEFLALAANRTFRDGDGQLSLDAGPFVAALEFATGRSATVLGKPSRAFFEAALASLGQPADESVMVGDDVESDVAGAMSAGLAGLLVRTGKYKDGDESTIDPRPTAVVADLGEAVDWVLDRAQS